MKKLLLSCACAALACQAFAYTPTPETKWGEWIEDGTSTIVFPDEEFMFTGTISDAPTFYRIAEDESGHMQYRFDNVFHTNTVLDEAPTPLLVDVYGDQITAYVQKLPTMYFEDFQEFAPGPYEVCDGAVFYDLEYYRMLNTYDPTIPMSMGIFLYIFDKNTGEEVCMGMVEIKSNKKAAFSIPSECVIGDDMGMGLLKVEADENVWSINYAIIKGDGRQMDWDEYTYLELTDRIIDHDENLMIMMWMAGDIMATPMEGPGRYTLGAVAYDENDNVIGKATSAVYYMPNESWNWKPLGNAKINEDMLRDVFSMNLDNAGIEHNGPVEYEAPIEECISQPGLYRVNGLYGPTHPYAPIFEYVYDFPVYTYFDCSDPDYCYIYTTPTGFIVKDDKSGEIIIGSEPATWINKGYTFDMTLQIMSYSFGKLSDGVIKFSPSNVWFSVPVFVEQLNEDWINGSWLTENDLTIKLPVGTGVESVDTTTKAEYYDLNGNRVANPGKGIYILRQGEKSVKIVK